MSECLVVRSVADVHAELDRLVDELTTLSLSSCAGEDIIEALRAHETLARRMTFVGYRLINEARDRRLPDEYGCPSMGRFLRPLLRLDPREAITRDRAAQAAGPGRALSGEPLPAPFAHVGAAQAAGTISERHARLIERTVDRLPDTVQAEHGEAIETELVGYAAQFDPAQLATLARRLSEHYDPDGAEPNEAHERERRAVRISPRADGWARLDGWLAPELTERWQTILDTYAAPKPAVDLGDGRGLVKDARTAAQRNHDGTLAAFETLMRVGDIPSNNGVSCTIIVTMSSEQYRSGTGLARTGHGHLVPTAEACTWGGGDTAVLAVALNSMRAVTAYGHTHRIFTETQRRVMTVRDGGCTFPACAEPPARCQADHMIRHEHSGPTTVDNGHLLCRYHHREHLRQGWKPTMINGVPHWIPPAIVDPHRKPVRNTIHDTRLRSDTRPD